MHSMGESVLLSIAGHLVATSNVELDGERRFVEHCGPQQKNKETAWQAGILGWMLAPLGGELKRGIRWGTAFC